MKQRSFLLVLVLACTFLVNAHADILITKLDDVQVSTHANLARDLVINERLCVASNPVGVYGLIALGSGNNGEFTINNGPYNIDYTVLYRDRRSGGGFVELQPGVPVGGFLTRPLRNSRNCRGNAGRLRIVINKETLNSAVAGRYQGVLQLSVIPE